MYLYIYIYIVSYTFVYTVICFLYYGFDTEWEYHNVPWLGSHHFMTKASQFRAIFSGGWARLFTYEGFMG